MPRGLIAAAAFLLAACNSAAPPPPVVEPAKAGVTPQSLDGQSGGGCKGKIARYRAVQDNDKAMGHVALKVYAEIQGEIAAAEADCSAGREAQADSLIRASETRHGYPTGI